MQNDPIQQPIKDQIDRIESLPPFPLLSNILKSFLQADSDGDIRPLISNIESEPSVTAKVLSVANSAFFGAPGQINSIRDATARLGLQQLKSIVYSLVLSARFKTKQCPHFEISRFWYNSMLQAYAGRIICTHSDFSTKVDKNEVYSIGLLQWIGVLALVDLNPEQMDNLLDSEASQSLSLLERQFYNIDHYDIGAALLKHWSLPETFCNVIEHLNKRDYKGSGSAIIQILQSARYIISKGAEVNLSELNPALGLDEEKLCRILNTLENESSWIKSFSQHL